MSGQSSSDPFSRTAVVVAVGLVAVLAVGVIVVGKILASDSGAPAATPTAAPTRTGPVALVPVDAPEAGSASCSALIGGLPSSLPSGSRMLPRLPLASPAPPSTEAWGDQVGDPVVLRCGLSRPPELTSTSSLLEISGVRWLRVNGDGASTWYVVDRAVYAALTVPGDAGTGPLQRVSEALAAVLPAQPR